MCIKTSKIIGAEALIRWIDPIKGFIPPNEFIPLAEENDFIIELGEWIIDDALNQYINWQKIGIDISISINISAKQFLQNNFEDILIKKIKDKSINPNKIILEITEYILIDQTDKVYLSLKKTP